jgi:hypothetical protein
VGQYWIPVSLDKREFINPHKLGNGMKLAEMLGGGHVGSALVILCAAMPEQRGGGDLDLTDNWHGPERKFPEHNITPGPMPEDYAVVAKRTIGRWAGDRIALVGDYAKNSDLPLEFHAADIFDECSAEYKIVYNKTKKGAAYQVMDNGPNHGKYAHHVETAPALYKDITDDVCLVIEHELCGKFVGTGWREFKHDGEENEAA